MENWAKSELGEADFGDKRRTKRFVQLARDLAAKPEGSVPQACGSWSSTKGAYRFWDNETHIITVADCEADIFELFVLLAKLSESSLLH